jgi:hypothetical protein
VTRGKKTGPKPTHLQLQAEALKYDTRSALSNGNRFYYRIAREMGVLDEICSHMKDGRIKKPTPLT